MTAFAQCARHLQNRHPTIPRYGPKNPIYRASHSFFISTPITGDYAWALFRQADKIQPGAYAQLDAKALKLTGGADSPKPPAGRGTYAWVMDQRQADVFLTYCTNAVAAQAEVPRLRVVQLPAALQVGAAYGLTVRADAPVAAQAFASALRQPPAQAVLQRLGFGQP